MLNFKKIITFVCTVALAATMYVVPVSAASAKATIGNGLNEPTGSGQTFITINVDEFSTTPTIGGTLMYEVTKGVFRNAVNVAWVDGAGGLWNEDAWAAPTVDVRLNTTYSADYDLLVVSWSGSCGFTTVGNNTFQIRLFYTDSTAKGDAIFTPVPSGIVLVEGTSAVGYHTSTMDGGSIVRNLSFEEDTNTYKLASGTNVVTVVEEEKPTPAVTATVLGDYTGDKTAAGNDDEADKTVAILGTPAAKADATSLVWTVTSKEDKTQEFTQSVDVSGEATYKFGLVLRNITADLINTVSAVLQ